MKIVPCEQGSKCFKEVESLFRRKWPEFSLEHNGDGLPPSLVTVIGNSVVAGIAFTRYPHPLTHERVVWINALYVATECRRQGLATQLVLLAIEKLKELGQPHVFAYTDIADLYLSMGWFEVSSCSDSSHKIMGYKTR